MTATDAPSTSNGHTPELVYRYADEAGTLRYEVVRRPPKKFLQRRPDGHGDWTWDLNDTPRIPYRLVNLTMAAENGLTAWVVEGEKDVERLIGLGLTATTNAGGAKWPWPDEWAEHFRGLHQVIVIADNDDPGRAAALQRAKVIAQTVPDVRVIEALPGVPAKGDVSDWIDAGGTLEELAELAERAPTITDLADAQDDDPPRKLLEVRWVDQINQQPPPEPPILVEGLMRRGELVVVGAPRAIGKSWLAMNLAALLGQGEGLFLGSLPIRQQCRTLIAQGELDQWGTYDRWRMLTGTGTPPSNVAETFDRWRIRIVKRRTSGHADGQGWSDEWIDAQLDGSLERTIVEHGFDVLVIDPWAVYFTGKENNSDETEAALDKLRDLSMRTGVAVVVMHHLRGSTGGPGNERIEPEDLWRGSSRLPDWASTRVTLLPHYNPKQVLKMGLTRRQARRYLDVFFLRRSTPTDDISIALNYETGWWEQWRPPGGRVDDVNIGRPAIELNPADVAQICIDKANGDWPTLKQATDDLAVSPHTAISLLNQAVEAGMLDRYTGKANAKGFRVPGVQLLNDESWKDVDF